METVKVTMEVHENTVQTFETLSETNIGSIFTRVRRVAAIRSPSSGSSTAVSSVTA